MYKQTNKQVQKGYKKNNQLQEGNKNTQNIKQKTSIQEKKKII